MTKRFLIPLLVIASILIKPSFNLCCRLGTSSTNPGLSCVHIFLRAPGCRNLNGYYWIEDSDGTPTQVYCNMNSRWQGGGWERIALFNSSVDTTCPGNASLTIYEVDLLNGRQNVSLCHTDYTLGSAPSFAIATFNITTKYYSEVLVKTEAYATGSGKGYGGQTERGNLNSLAFVDGIAVTINDTEANNYKHVFVTHTSTLDERSSDKTCSPKIMTKYGLPPDLLGYDEYCATYYPRRYIFYPNSNMSIWNVSSAAFGHSLSQACFAEDSGCLIPKEFHHKVIPKRLTSKENPLFMRIMSTVSSRMVALSYFEMYVR